MTTVDYVDLQKFMGSWHVLADIPTVFDKNISQPLEHYSLNPDGTIQTTYSFYRNGRKTEMNAKGFVLDRTGNALWGMQFVWPIKADYRIAYVSEDYEFCIIGREKRDYVWVMGRQPVVSMKKLEELLGMVESLGYDRGDLRVHNVIAERDPLAAGLRK
jgi:apolipoprotein D and lipocalin family protein